MELTRVIKSPILTEKTDTLRAGGVYTFKVDYHANKHQIAQAIETIFNVKVTKVNTIKVEKQPKSVGRFHGFTNRYKKAMVWIEGDSLNYLPEDQEAVESEEAKASKAEKAAKASEVENKVAAKLAQKKASATKAAKAPVKQTTTRRKMGAE
ncbi:50S ribosomal protein L23 [Mycoplasmopsis gallopavonis]|uniref:Large ribosomal subunit protein uL23 n=1 Tax=Mycoplasmopsis gallopavonis TaxID=76629 RepID=A0A449AYZ6_9BACT|nr:50S ribosomal protein L23 [Mycoplasmopsis gallopavonis]RIV16582.1 50S ribosomal protein L23 [Mycoplasmopsis gallopavonis]VEU72712.1 50S ribosomal protein L23 [Mycoplasmopsis gallopavonis]